MTDEEFEKGMHLLFNSEVPEESCFTFDKNEEIQVCVVNKKIFNSKCLCRAIVCILLVVAVFPLINIIHKNIEKDDASLISTEILERIGECERVYSFGEYLKNEKCLRLAGLIPDEEYDISDAEIFVYTVSDGRRKIYTQEAYTVWYDEDGKAFEFMMTKESVSDEFSENIIGADCFKGEFSSVSGVRNIESMFRNKSAEVIYEGEVIRKSLDEYGMPEQELHTDMICMYSRYNGQLVPMCVYNISCTLNCNVFKGDDIPDTTAGIIVSENLTEYNITLAYDCSRNNAIRLEENRMIKENIWNHKTERTE